MTMQPYTKSCKRILANLMTDYMEELNCDIPEHIIRGKLSDFIDEQYAGGTIRITLAMEHDRPIGFSVYQVDTPDSDWCKRPGWGFIREFYVVPDSRKNGTGRALAACTERELRSMGAEQLYLTSTTAIPFWQRCGWHLTEELCSNGQYILEK